VVNKDQLLSLLSRHIGEANGLTAEQIALALCTPRRHVRTLVSELRMDGVAVCGTPRDGYFIAGNATELETTCAFLHSRALHSLMLESRLRKVPFEDLVGQLRLPT
jgi:biotin operon repressor